MIEIRTRLRRWGNSFGIIVPQKMIKGEGVNEGDEIVILFKKNENNVLKEISGTLKGWKIDSQKFKDELRKEEEEAEKRKWKN